MLDPTVCVDLGHSLRLNAGVICNVFKVLSHCHFYHLKSDSGLKCCIGRPVALDGQTTGKSVVIFMMDCKLHLIHCAFTYRIIHVIELAASLCDILCSVLTPNCQLQAY